MVLIQIGDRFIKASDFRIDEERPVQEDKEDREMRVSSQEHEIDEHRRIYGN